MTERLLTTHEVAELLGFTTETILRKVRRGELPAIKLPGGRIRYRPDELEAWLEEHELGAPPPGQRKPLGV
jgi:excisionase family DNA binding protein